MNSRTRTLSRREHDKKVTVSSYVARETEENHKYIWRLTLRDVAQCGLFHITEDSKVQSDRRENLQCHHEHLHSR
jgi:hypothetical protein